MKYVLSLFLLIVMNGPACAGLIMRLERTGSSVDFPNLTLSNMGPGHVSAFTLTIGDEEANFDSAVLVGTSAVDYVLLSPDDLNAGDRSDVLAFSFLGLGPLSEITWKLDLDRDSGSATVDWQTTLFNNGALDNAIATVFWSNDNVSTLELMDQLNRDPLTPYEVEIPFVVPEVSTFTLAAIAAMFLSIFRRFT